MGFRVAGQWAGKDKLACNDCPFDTVVPRLMDGHLRTAHQASSRRSPVLGPDGTPAVVETPTEAPQDDLQDDDQDDEDDGPFRNRDREPAGASYGRLLSPFRRQTSDGEPDPKPGREADQLTREESEQ